MQAWCQDIRMPVTNNSNNNSTLDELITMNITMHDSNSTLNLWKCVVCTWWSCLWQTLCAYVVCFVDYLVQKHQDETPDLLLITMLSCCLGIYFVHGSQSTVHVYALECVFVCMWVCPLKDKVIYSMPRENCWLAPVSYITVSQSLQSLLFHHFSSPLCYGTTASHSVPVFPLNIIMCI